MTALCSFMNQKLCANFVRGKDILKFPVIMLAVRLGKTWPMRILYFGVTWIRVTNLRVLSKLSYHFVQVILDKRLSLFSLTLYNSWTLFFSYISVSYSMFVNHFWLWGGWSAVYVLYSKPFVFWEDIPKVMLENTTSDKVWPI